MTCASVLDNLAVAVLCHHSVDHVPLWRALACAAVVPGVAAIVLQDTGKLCGASCLQGGVRLSFVSCSLACQLVCLTWRLATIDC